MILESHTAGIHLADQGVLVRTKSAIRIVRLQMNSTQ